MEKPTPPPQRRAAKSHSLPFPSSSPTASDRRRSSISDASPKRRDSPAFAVLWPSSNRSQSQPSLSLADHLTHDRLRDLQRTLPPAGTASPKSILRQRSYSEVDKRSSKKKHNPKGSRSPTIVGGSMRQLHLPPSPKSTGSPACAGASLTPSSVLCSRSLSARRSKTSDVLGLYFLSSDSSPTAAPSNSLSQGRRSGSASPEPRAAKGKSNGSFISLGLDLFRRKWKIENTTTTTSSSSSSSSPSSSPTSSGLKKNRAKEETWHQLKLMSNRLIQWRWTNARSDRTYHIKTTQAEVNLLSAWLLLSNSQAKVLSKRLQMEKNKLHLKLTTFLPFHLKVLEEWNSMSQQHSNALTATKDCLLASVCRVPLTDGAKVDLHPFSLSLRYATELALMTRTTTSRISHTEASAELLELKQIVKRERTLLQECCLLLTYMSSLHVEEQSLKAHLIQLQSKSHCL